MNSLPKEAFEHIRQKMGVIPFQKLLRRKHNIRDRYDEMGSCQKEEIQEILNSITGYPLLLMLKGEEIKELFPSMPKGENVEFSCH